MDSQFTRLAPQRPGVQTVTTTEHSLIRRWAEAHGAEPATGEATVSGPAKLAVNDGGVGIRFNFPGAAAFRPIEWDEWFEHFDRHHLSFVFEEQDTAQVASRAYAMFEAAGGVPGHDQAHWAQSVTELEQQAGGASSSGRYRIE
jgi:hypothetical protein